MKVDKQKKKLSVMIPCYNEEENVVQIYKAVKAQFENNLPQYDYEILFIDNNSSDNTRALLRTVCKDDKKVKAIFNAKNFGQFNSPYHAMCQTTGECTICMCCDFQDPPELIPQFVHEWEKGYKIVSGIKAKSKENPFIRFCMKKKTLSLKSAALKLVGFSTKTIRKNSVTVKSANWMHLQAA